MLPFSLHNGDPLTPLRITEFLTQLRSELNSGKPVFQSLIQRYLLTNPHKVVLEMTPSEGFIKSKNENEAKILANIEKELKDTEKEEIEKEVKELKAAQDATQNLDVLPTLQVTDISPNTEETPYNSTHTLDSLPVYFIQQPTNGISYIRLKVNLTDLPEELREIMPLYVKLVNKMGTKRYSHAEFDNMKDLVTVGGVNCSLMVGCDRDSLESHSEIMMFSVGFLDRNTEKAVKILEEVLRSVNFHEYEHSSLLLQRSVKGRTDDLIGNGVSFASSHSSASLTSAGHAYDLLSTLQFDCKLASNLLQNSSSMNSIAEKLDQIHGFAMNKSRLEVCVHTSDLKLMQTELLARVEQVSSGLTQTFPEFSQTREIRAGHSFNRRWLRDYFTLQGRVNFVVESFLSVPYSHPDYSTLCVLCELLTANFLHKEIREKGGAYGSGANVDALKGVVTLFSYRDPRNVQTYESFLWSLRQCSEGKFE